MTETQLETNKSFLIFLSFFFFDIYLFIYFLFFFGILFTLIFTSFPHFRGHLADYLATGFAYTPLPSADCAQLTDTCPWRGGGFLCGTGLPLKRLPVTLYLGGSYVSAAPMGRFDWATGAVIGWATVARTRPRGAVQVLWISAQRAPGSHAASPGLDGPW